ncbi:hypothetical protein RCIP0023_00189 [Klebsiella phage RCIP0023]
MHGVLTSQSMKVVFKGEDEISLESEIVQECRSFSEFKDLDIHTHGDYFHHYTIQYNTKSIEPKNYAPQIMKAALLLISIATKRGLVLVNL